MQEVCVRMWWACWGIKLEQRAGNEHSFISKMQLGARVRMGLKEFSFLPYTGSVLMHLNDWERKEIKAQETFIEENNHLC